MERRTYLAGLAVGLGALAGCQGAPSAGSSDGSGGGSGGSGTEPSANDETQTPFSSSGSALREDDLPLSDSDLVRGASKDAIPAITDPVFGDDWSDVAQQAEQYDARLPTDPELEDDDTVIGVARGGEARAYPLKILNWHEIVNDEFAGPLLVTYCPLCGSGVTAERRVAGEVTNFGVSGWLWNSDLVMYDVATESLWSQVLGKAVRGPQTGEDLSLLPSSFTSWGSWKESYPDTKVLLPPPISNTITGRTSRDYSRNPYASYDESRRVGLGYNDFDDERLHPKAQVIGVHDGSTARAYPLQTLQDEGIVNDTVGDLPVVVAAGDDGSLFAYDRRVDGETLTFERAGANAISGGGSNWQLTTGRAVDGSHEGTRLNQANDRSQMFWFAWLDFFPESTVYGMDN